MSMDEQKCLVIDISRGTTHDGPGMRTTVFFKGCPLNCLWCQNPEGIQAEQEIWWEGRKCIHCLSCRQSCPTGAVVEDEDGLHIDQARCTLCGACVEACPSMAMSFTGQEWTLDQLLKEALKDKDYYTAFGGGVTVSGGEPLRRPAFVTEFFKRLKEQGINTALDTCGMVPAEAVNAVLPYTDIVLYDIKLFDSELHKQYTGQHNSVILKNLTDIADYLRKVNAQRNRDGAPPMKLWIRTPLIPHTTATQANISAISRFICEQLQDVVERWELCAFNSACKSKYRKMGQTWAYENDELMNQAFIDEIKAAALSTGLPAEKLVISGLIAKAACQGS
jgi:pyruvate formate lyase activating enzyme